MKSNSDTNKTAIDYLRLFPRSDKRDASVEILRIYACIMVVLAHIQLPYSADGQMTSHVLLYVKCLIADNVPIFFTILGFYFFTKVQDGDRLSKIPSVYLSKLKSFVARIYIPTIIVTLLCCFAYDFIYGQRSFGELFTNPDFHGELLTNYVFKQQPMDMVGQFWYIVSYIRLLIFFPLYAVVCADEKWFNYIRRGYMVLCFFVMITGDICYLTGSEPFIDLGGYVLDRNALFILVGYEVYLFFRKTKMSRTMQAILGAVLFISGSLCRYSLTLVSFNKYGVGNSDHFMVMECAASYITSAGALILVVALFKGVKSGILQFCGEMTLYIFMLHGIMMRVFSSTGDSIRESLAGKNADVAGVEYYFLYGSLLCLTSVALGLVIREIYAIIRYGCYRLYGKKRVAHKETEETDQSDVLSHGAQDEVEYRNGIDDK